VLGSLLGAFFVSLLCFSDSNGLDGFRSFGEFFSFYFLGVTTMNPSDSPFEIKALNDDMGHVYEVFCETNDERQRDLSKKQATDPLVEEKMRRLNGEIDRLEQKMQTLANAQKRSARGVPTETFASSDNEEALQHKAAFRRFLKTGQDDGLLSWQTKAMSATSGVDGGFLVPSRLHEEIVKAIDANTPFRSLSRVITISNDSVDVVVDDTLTAAAWAAETAARPETNTSTIQKINIPVHELFAHPKITQRLLDDAAFDVESWIAEKIAENMGLLEQTAFISGTGTGQPKGILTHPAGTATGQIEQLKTGVAGAFATTNPGDILVRLMLSLERRYMDNAVWLMNRSLLSDIRTFKDSTGQYLWQPALDGKTSTTLLGYPVVLIEQMPNRAAGSLSVAFGDVRTTYTIADRTDISVLRDPYTAKPNVMFYAVKRVGGAVVNTRSIKLLNFNV
jgi:HK97 family phage major capsid protein